MKHKLLGATVCFLLRRHAWRRLRQAERAEIPVTERANGWEGTTHYRICSRCGVRRPVKQKKVAA